MTTSVKGSPMHDGFTPDIDFFDWYGALSDEEQCEMLDVLRLVADSLGVSGMPGSREEIALAHDAFNICARVTSQLPLN